MKYAVVASGGKQYVASVGKILTVDKIDLKVGDKFNFENILLLREDDSLLIGTPNVAGAQVSGTVIKQYQGEKLDVMKFKAKVRYRRKIGFRPQLTDIQVEKINTTGKTSPGKKA